MDDSCDCAKRLFQEVKDYIAYKISAIDIQKYLSAQGDVDQLQAQVEQLMSDLDYQFRHVLQKLTVTTELEDEIDGYYKLLQAKYEDLPDLSTDQVTQALRAVDQTLELVGSIQSSRYELELLRQQENARPQEFQQQCIRQLDTMGKRLQEVDNEVRAIYDQVQRYTAEHQLLESQVIELFKH